MTRETLAFARGERQVLIRKVYLQNFIAEVATLLEQEFKTTKVELKVELELHRRGALRRDQDQAARLQHRAQRDSGDAEGRPVHVQRRPRARIADADVRRQRARHSRRDRRKLFESFVTSGKKSGTGLGLAIVKTIAEEHGGTVGFKSKPGKGTTFEVRLPLEGPAQRRRPTGRQVAHQQKQMGSPW